MMDIDIDFGDREKILNIIEHTRARRLQDGAVVHHNTGIYAQDIPKDPISNIAGIEYREAEERGYFKIDFLNVNLYKSIKNEDHLIRLMEIEPLWELLEQDDFTDLLFHINGYGTILRQMKPRTVEELAMLLAIIRPAKRHLVGKTWKEISTEVWKRPENDEYYFKKSHAIAYAMAIIVQMNLICESVSYDYS